MDIINGGGALDNPGPWNKFGIAMSPLFFTSGRQCQPRGSVCFDSKKGTTIIIFFQMENIGLFLTACENYGLQKQDIFQTVDLYEAENMAQVCSCV